MRVTTSQGELGATRVVEAGLHPLIVLDFSRRCVCLKRSVN
jgi:hypothetical protein